MVKRKENRANQSEEAKEEARRRDREAKKLKRASLSQCELGKRRETERIKKRHSRSNRSLEKLLTDREKDRKRQAVKRLQRELDELDKLANAALDSVVPSASNRESSQLIEHLLRPSPISSEYHSSNVGANEPQVSVERYSREESVAAFEKARANETQVHTRVLSIPWQSTGTALTLSSTSNPGEAETIEFGATGSLRKRVKVSEKPTWIGAEKNSKIEIEGECVQELWETPSDEYADAGIPSNEEDTILDFSNESSWESARICMSAEEFSRFLEEDESREHVV